MNIHDINLLCLTEETWEGQFIMNTSLEKKINFFIKKEEFWFDEIPTNESNDCAEKLIVIIKELTKIKNEKKWNTLQFKEEEFDQINNMYTATFEKGIFIFDFHYYGSMENVAMFIYIKGISIDESKRFCLIEVEDANKLFDEEIFQEIWNITMPKSKHRIRLVNWRG